MAKPRRKAARKYIKKAAMVGGAAATATAMTVAMAAPSANAAAAGPNYTQIITDSSNSLNNILFIAGNLGGTAAAIWDPLATAIPGGLLPTFTAGTQQDDLTSIAGLLSAISQITVPDLSGVPGLPPNATTTLTGGLLPGIGAAIPIFAPVTGAVIGLATLSGRLAALDAIPLLDGVPTLGDLIPGFTVTQTTFNSAYNWPLLGLGPVLGLNGSTTLSNTFAQLPSLTGTALVTEILSGLNVGGNPVLPPAIQTAVNAILAPVNGIATPSVTAWIPAGQGNYGLPLGGQIGWLATMPTLDVGPVPLLSTTDTVIAIPILAAGAVLPLGLASFGTVATPGVVFPTATGVSTLGGTSLTSLAVPSLGLSLTNLNLLSATYLGTNGVNYNSGTSLAVLTTPLGAIPIVYSLGAYNLGTTGFGFTLPSLFTVGLLPPFQVGTAPTQQSPDGLIPASVLNLGLAVPTQATDLVTLLGLPNPGSFVTPVLNPVFNIVVTPVGTLITNGLNSLVGPLANGLASGIAQLTALLAQLSGSVAAITPTGAAATTAAPTPQNASLSSSGSQPGLNSTLPEGITQNATVNGAQTSEPINVLAAPVPNPGPRLNVITQTGNSVTELIEEGTDQARTGVTNARTQLTTTVNSVTKPVTATVTNVTKQVTGGLSKLGSSGGSTNSTASSTSSGTS